jgi:hypothetical protein
MQINSSISYIKNKVETYGLQRSNRFEVSITRNGDPVADSIPIFGAKFPNKSVGVIGDFTSGPNIGRNVPVNFDFDKTSSLLLTMAIDAKWTNFKAINDWVESIVNDGSKLNGSGTGFSNNRYTYVNNYTDILGQVIVVSLDMQDRISSTFIFSEAYPIGIFPLDFGEAEKNAVMFATVEFNFRTYTFKPS